MMSPRKPDDAFIERYLVGHQQTPFNYPQVGATAERPPDGYNVDRHEILLGHGAATFQRARQAVTRWRMNDLGWVRLCFPSVEIKEGKVFATLTRVMGIWTLNPCKIIYVIEDAGEVERFGFAFGTLEEHAESGEERFSVEWDKSSDEVRYRILAFSRTKHPLAKLAGPIARRVQRRFFEDSKASMKAFVDKA